MKLLDGLSVRWTVWLVTNPRHDRILVVLPVYNESAVIASSIERLYLQLANDYPDQFDILVVDNGSTDSTVSVAQQSAVGHDDVSVVSIDGKGRGLALRHAWGSTDAAVVAYMDADLSTDLSHLKALIDPLLHGTADITYGSRLEPESKVERGIKREVISRSYNILLRIFLGVRIRDAQCGFKAARTEVAQSLLPQIENDNWFFDTEMLVLGLRRGLRVRSVPVRWVDDRGSTVDIVATVLEDLRGIYRLRRELKSRS